MANGICIFAENYKNTLEPVVGELMSVANSIKASTGEKIIAIVLSSNCDNLVESLKALGVDEILAVNTVEDTSFKDEINSHIIAEMIRKIEPTSVLIPATMTGRSIFSRVAAKLNCGLTADCTEVVVDKNENGNYYIKQNKPSFGENVMVTIITKEECYPQMLTIRPGVYPSVEASEQNVATVVNYMTEVEIPKSKLQVVGITKAQASTESIVGAEVVVVGGRGATGENFELLNRFASKLEAAIGGTRPLIDEGVIPFENQIGQTGCTVRPKICVSLGVSGAIQHTEGIKDTKLFIAVNTDESAPIYNLADYGVALDFKSVLEAYLGD